MAQVQRKNPAQDPKTGKFISPEPGGVAPWLQKSNDDAETQIGGGKRKTMVKQVPGGISLVGIDPGKTTGLAVWDAWDQRWYVDQLDAGRGRKVRIKVHGGFVESSAMIDGADELGLRLASGIQVVRGGGNKTKLAIDAVVERTVVQTLIDVLLAVGPRTIVVLEDFVIGHAGGEGLQAVQIGRDGLSPVRLNARLMQKADDMGLWQGDAWRVFDCGWWTGGDGRGVHVLTHDAVTGNPLGGVPDFRRRLTRVEQWRLGEVVAQRGAGAVWGGSGPQLEIRLPSQRVWMAGGAKAQEAAMRDMEVWTAGLPHAMVAMQHAHAVGREIGSADLAKGERIWNPSAKIRNRRVSAKSVRPT
jgi:hypothetical protein